jgi:hypothetical protein
MDSPLNSMQHWEFGAVGIADPKTSTLRRYFDLIHLTRDIEGDIAEFGVAKGHSLITTALILNDLKIDKKVWGFDTFRGFPKLSPEDDFNNFELMFKRNELSTEHWSRIIKNKKYIQVREVEFSPLTVSNSADFSKTSFDMVQSKVEFFKLQNLVNLRQGDFTENLESKINETKFSLILMDSDLYLSYHKVLPVIWNHLNPGGYIYFDEYYSLKFPGPRLAVNSFVQKYSCNLVRLEDWLDFERWALVKI